MTRNLRTQLIDQAEHALRCWHGDDMTREQAAALLPTWRHAAGLDDDLRAEVLSRFPAAEPPSVPGRDWLPAVEADAAAVVALLDVSAPEKALHGLVSNACTCGHSEPEHITGVCMSEVTDAEYCPCGTYVRAVS